MSHPAAPITLVGRERERDLLRARLAGAMTGAGSVVLIGGEAGIGKTALAEDLCREALTYGTTVLTGHCYDLTETPPYGPWLVLRDRYRANAPAQQTSETIVLPGLTSTSDRGALFEEVGDFLRAVSTRQPLVVLLEDLHWADAASLDLLRFIARRVSTLTMLLVVTYRADELHRHHPLGALIPLLVREAPVERLDLRPLDRPAARTLVTDRYELPNDEADRLASYLIDRSEGNPLSISELLRTLEDERLLVHAEGRWQVGAVGRAPVPQMLKQVIDARLYRLGDQADALLAIAAVTGHEVPLAILAMVTRVDEETLLTLVERAEAAQLVQAWTHGDGFRFAHALYREVLYESVPALRRRRIHLRVGEVLAESTAPDPDAVAYHFLQAGDERAAAWLVRAGERAEDSYALVAAADRYITAFELLDARQGDPAERGWLRLQAAALRRYQDPERAFAWVEQAAPLAAEADDPSFAVRAQAMLGLLGGYLGKYELVMPALPAAVDAIAQLPPSTGRAYRREQLIDRFANRGTMIMAFAYYGHFPVAYEQAERYLAALPATARTAAQHGALADAHWALSLVHAMRGEPAPARRSYAASVDAYRAINHHLAALINQQEELMLVVLPYHADNLPERERVVAAAEQTALRLVESGAYDDSDVAHYVRLPLLLVEGRWREARRLVDTPDVPHLMDHLNAYEYLIGTLARLQGDAERAWRQVRTAWPADPGTVPGSRIVGFALPLQRLAAALALDQHDLALARVWLDAHQHWLVEFLDATLGRSELQALEAEWQRAAGDPARARVHAEQALAHAQQPRQPLALLAAHRLLAELAIADRHFTAAGQHVEAALALAEACAAPYERALTLLAGAELALALDDVATATAALEEARELCQALDAHPALARANDLAGRLTEAAAAPASYPAGLSAREAEVLRHVAAGLTNAQIGELLFLSPRTINEHLTTIYAKLGVPSRAAAIRFALDHGLD